MGLLFRRPDSSSGRADQEVLQQVREAMAEAGMAEGESRARELMSVHYDPGYPSNAYLTAWDCRLFALRHLGQHADAAEGLRALADAVASAFGDSDSRAAKFRNDSAVQLALLGRYDQAESDHRYVLALAATAQPGRHRIQLRLSALNGLIFADNMRGQYAEAESAARDAIRKMEKSAGIPRSVFNSLYCNLAKSLNGQGQHAEAERKLQYFPRSSVGVLLAMTVARVGLNRLDEAEADAREAVRLTDGHLGSAHHVRLDATLQLGIVLARQGNADQARPLLQANAQAWTEHFGDQHPKTIDAVSALAEINGHPGQAH